MHLSKDDDNLLSIATSSAASASGSNNLFKTDNQAVNKAEIGNDGKLGNLKRFTSGFDDFVNNYSL